MRIGAVSMGLAPVLSPRLVPTAGSVGTPDTSGRIFATTHWTVVLAARGDGPEARLALG